MQSLRLLFLLLLCLAAYCTIDNTANALSPVEVAALAKPATVGVYASAGDDKYYGTGVIISKDGYILTSTSVVPSNADKITIYFEDHTSLPADIIEISNKAQSVILKVNSINTRDFPFLKLQKSLPNLADPIYTLGNASNMIKLGDGVSFSAGVVSGLYRIPVKASQTEDSHNLMIIETDAAVNDGQDGGGLLNSNGEIAGIITRDYSRFRWQGAAIPTELILDSMHFFSTSGSYIISSTSTPAPSSTFKNVSNRIMPKLVRIQVDRLYPDETLDYPEWSDYKSDISGWDELSEAEQRRIIVDFFSTESLLAANQMLRRPPDPVTGLVISPDGYIITSAFNVESTDRVYIDKISGKPRKTTYKGSMERLLKESSLNIEEVSNRVTGTRVILADGTEIPASIIGFSTPLGIALLKINPEHPLEYFDITSNLSSPELAERIAILGVSDTSYTINTGIVSATSRDNNNYFQVDALLNYGNSGGPIINHAGEFLGLAARPLTPSPISGCILPFRQTQNNTAPLLPALNNYTSTPNSGISMGVKAEQIASALPRLIAGEGINKSNYISLGLFPSEKDPYTSEVIVGTVQNNSPALKAGFKKGDIIKQMDGIGIRSWSEINNYVSQKKKGQVIIFSIRRPLGRPHIVLNGKKISTAEELHNFINSNPDGSEISGHISSPAVSQKIYVTL